MGTARAYHDETWNRAISAVSGTTGVLGNPGLRCSPMTASNGRFAWRCCKAHTGPVRKVVMAKPDGRQGELLIRSCEV